MTESELVSEVSKAIEWTRKNCPNAPYVPIKMETIRLMLALHLNAGYEVSEAENEIEEYKHLYEHYKSLHEDNCIEYDKVVAEREHFRNLVRNTDALEEENKRLQGLIEVYDKIFTHNLVPDKGYFYFVCGEGGKKDKNNLPERLHVCPAYGCDWFQVYERTDKTAGTEW